jgi:hypothetical protein
MKTVCTVRLFAFFATIFLLVSGCKAEAQGAAGGSKPSPFTICTNQTYALCATASCFVFDDVAYCQCDVLTGNSITATDGFDDGQNACTVNASGVDNGFMVSLFSVPSSVLPGGNQALYTCPASTSNGAYGQCDGGICFTSTQGKSFPGFSEPLGANQIICSCPITKANPATAKIGYQIVGPFPCQKSFLENCKQKAANKQNGASIPVGAPAGVPRLLAIELEGTDPHFNQCK